MGKGFAFPRHYGKAETLAASLERNNRELSSFLNKYVITQDDNGDVALPGGLTVAGNASVGGLIASGGVGARMYLSSDQGPLTANVGTTIAFNTEAFDTHGSIVDTSNNRFTIPTGYGGLWLVGAATEWASPAPTRFRFEAIHSGSTAGLLHRRDSMTYGTYGSVEGSVLIDADDGDTVHFTAFVNPSITLRGHQGYTYAWAVKIS